MWLVEETKLNLPLELDFTHEGRNSEMVGKLLQNHSWLKVGNSIDLMYREGELQSDTPPQFPTVSSGARDRVGPDDGAGPDHGVLRGRAHRRRRRRPRTGRRPPVRVGVRREGQCYLFIKIIKQLKMFTFLIHYVLAQYRVAHLLMN